MTFIFIFIVAVGLGEAIRNNPKIDEKQEYRDNIEFNKYDYRDRY